MIYLFIAWLLFAVHKLNATFMCTKTIFNTKYREQGIHTYIRTIYIFRWLILSKTKYHQLTQCRASSFYLFNWRSLLWWDRWWKLYVRVCLCIKHLVLSFLFSVLNAKFVAIQIIFGEFYRYFQSISVGFCEA